MKVRISSEETTPSIEEAMQAYNLLPEWLQIPFGIMLQTGCRPSEMEQMFVEPMPSGFGLYGDEIVWPCGKNQRAPPRKEKLDLAFLEKALRFHSINGRGKRFVSMTGDSFTRKFLKYRRQIGWDAMVLVPQNSGIVQKEYERQVKGLRKLFFTKLFYDKYWECGDAYVALLFTCKRARHSTEYITANHYLSENPERLGLHRFKDVPMHKIFQMFNQTQLTQFYFVDKEKVETELIQQRLV